MSELDREAYLWVTEHRLGWLDPVFVALTAAGYAGVLWIALALALPVMRRRATVPVLAPTALAVVTVDLFVSLLKELIDRPRPFRSVPSADPLVGYTVGDSFPSGHAATSFAGAVVLSLFFVRLAPAFFPLAAAIAFSRIYVGVHYPADVVGGAAIGALWAAAGYVAIRALRRRSAGLRAPTEARAYSRRAP